MPLYQVGQHHAVCKKANFQPVGSFEFKLFQTALPEPHHARWGPDNKNETGLPESVLSIHAYGITGAVYASVVPSAHSNTSTSGVCTSNCTNENPIKSRAFNPSTPSSGSM